MHIHIQLSISYYRSINSNIYYISQLIKKDIQFVTGKRIDLIETCGKFERINVPILSTVYKWIEKHPIFCIACIVIIFLLVVLSIFLLPSWQISQFGITNTTEKANLENQYRVTIIQIFTTLAQILGGIAVIIGLYYTWRRINIAEDNLKATQDSLKVTQENLKVAQEGQIIERFTRALDQLGDEKIEIRLGGIYALEKFSKKLNDNEDDDWPIIDILTAYIRKNSPVNNEYVKNENIIIKQYLKEPNEIHFIKEGTAPALSLDIQAILTVIKRYQFKGPSRLDLQKTYLRGADLQGANLCEVNLYEADLEKANLNGADLKEANLVHAKLIRACLQNADLRNANLDYAILVAANLEKVFLEGANLQNADLQQAVIMAELKNAYLYRTNLKNATLAGANLEGANLYEANLEGANLYEARNLSLEQLSKVKTLYNVILDDKLLIPLKEKHPHLFDKPE